MRKCKLDVCDRKHFGKGYCHKHYMNWSNTGDPLKTLRDIHRESVNKYFLRDDTVVVLSIRGNDYLIDLEDKVEVAKHVWNITPNGYAKSYGKLRETLHRFLLEPPIGKVVDHINGDITDNRRSNLRIVTPAFNNMNRRKPSGKTSKFYGVSKCKRNNSKPWVARAHRRHIGYFATEIEAAQAYDEVIRNKYGNDLPCNFDN